MARGAGYDRVAVLPRTRAAADEQPGPAILDRPEGVDQLFEALVRQQVADESVDELIRADPQGSTLLLARDRGRQDADEVAMGNHEGRRGRVELATHGVGR